MEIDCKIFLTFRLDFLYYDKVTKSRKFSYFDNQTVVTKDFSSLFSSSIDCEINEIYNKYPIPESQSSSFVDIDGDCRNDLLIVSNNENERYLEIWKGRIEDNNIKYCLSKSSTYILDTKLGDFTIADIDRDGMLDIVFPILDTNSILVAFNKIKNELDWSADYCETHQNMTVVTDLFNKFSIGNVNDEVFQ